MLQRYFLLTKVVKMKTELAPEGQAGLGEKSQRFLPKGEEDAKGYGCQASSVRRVTGLL